MNMTKYRYRFIARVTLEAASPIAVGSGNKDIITDATVVRDINGLPYIPGISIAGVIRHSLGDKPYIDDLFGFQEREQGRGSRIIVSDALLVGEDGKVVDGLVETSEREYLNNFKVLPIRQHVCINEKGTAQKYGKFDEEVVYVGTRFCFEMEILTEDSNDSQMQDIMQMIFSPTFRLGSGTRNGLGLMKTIRVQYAIYDLTKKEDLQSYICKSSCLAEEWNAIEVKDTKPQEQDGWVRYTLTLKPLDFFIFSSGFGDDNADMTPVKERHISWWGNTPAMSEDYFLIPGTSVKGAVAHRTAYYWNRYNNCFIDKVKDKALACEKNPAVVAIFGTATEKDNIIPQCGNAIFSDVVVKNSGEKVIFHIKMDKFTGSVQDGALFQEKVSNIQGQQIIEEILVDKRAFADSTVKKAFESSLHDICNGLLPLGGGTNRGNGIFIGTLTIDE